MGRHTVWALLGLALLAVSLHGQVNADTLPSESECRPYIEKAIHELQGETVEDKAEETTETTVTTEQPIDEGGSSNELQADQPEQTEDQTESGEGTEESGDVEKAEGEIDGSVEGDEASAEAEPEAEASADETENAESGQTEESGEQADQPAGESGEEEKSDETSTDEPVAEASTDETENAESGQTEESGEQAEKADDGEASAEEVPEQEADNDTKEDTKEETENPESGSDDDNVEPSEAEGSNEAAEVESGEKLEGSNEDEAVEAKADTAEDTKEDETDEQASAEAEPVVEDEIVAETAEESGSRVKREISDDTAEDTAEDTTEDTTEETAEESGKPEETDDKDSTETDGKESVEEVENLDAQIDPAAQNGGSTTEEASTEEEPATTVTEAPEESGEDAESGEKSHPEEDLLLEFEIPENLRARDHITELLHLDDVSSTTENAIHKTADVILKELKKIYDSAIKPLEVQYKYRDLSNRHFGDPEIFSKPLVLFMGPWSGGKSTILNYLTDNEYTVNSLRTGAEPSPAYFNILMHGDEPEVLDGTQLAADWTFSGLQKFGEGMLDRLRGLRMPNKLLEKVNIVEIPGILEVRKQVSRLFPFNDACQWFIDRADIIFLVYDPAKLDVGPETEAILDQLKGREYQTRIVLNKADTVKPEELMRVQGALIWNISPLMSSAQPPVMYTVSLWSHPFDSNAPIRLLQAQERALLRDLRGAIDKRIENKIASARRFAVRVRNHAKMVDCYLTTYYNHKTLFGNKKQISEQIISNPQNYHIYEGISTLTNISRYDLPDPDVYRDFFRLNPLYEFKKLVETCTYFNGCPINKLDVAIAYDLPELVGKYKKALEVNLAAVEASETGAKPKS